MDDNKVVDILLKEYELHRRELLVRFNHGINLMGIVFGALLAAFSVAVEKHTILLVILPWCAGFLIVYAAHHYMVMELTTAYLSDLETRLKVLDYERCVTKLKWKDAPFFRNPIKLVGACFPIPFIAMYLLFIYEAAQYLLAEHKGLTLLLDHLAAMCGRLVGTTAQAFTGVFSQQVAAVILIALPTMLVCFAAGIQLWGMGYASRLPDKRAYASGIVEVDHATNAEMITQQTNTPEADPKN